jgi:hypothetical protein
MPISNDPGFARRQLSAMLRAARASTDKNRDEVAEELVWSLSKLVRIEAGDQGVSVTDIRALLSVYGIADPDEVRTYTDLARTGRARPWFSDFHDLLSKQFAQLLGNETSAASVTAFHPYLVPGLAQTDGYARHLLQAVRPSSEQADRLADLRSMRQEKLLGAPRPPELVLILADEALLRPVGGPAVMVDQLEHLLDLARQPSVTVRIVPLDAGAYRGLGGPFTLLGFDEPDDWLVFLETTGGDLVSRDEAYFLRVFRQVAEELDSVALLEDETRTRIGQIINEFRSVEAGPVASPQAITAEQ